MNKARENNIKDVYHAYNDKDVAVAGKEWMLVDHLMECLIELFVVLLQLLQA